MRRTIISAETQHMVHNVHRLIDDVIAQYKKENRKIIQDEHGLNFYEGMTPKEKIEWIQAEIKVLQRRNIFLKQHPFYMHPQIAQFFRNGYEEKDLGDFLNEETRKAMEYSKKQIAEYEAEIKEYQEDIQYYQTIINKKHLNQLELFSF